MRSGVAGGRKHARIDPEGKYLSCAKKALDPAHEKLKETGFLADHAWEDIPSIHPEQKRKDWYILYYPERFSTTYQSIDYPEMNGSCSI